MASTWSRTSSTGRELARHAIAGIDLNLGCPAPKVYKKNAGGWRLLLLLQDLPTG